MKAWLVFLLMPSLFASAAPVRERSCHQTCAELLSQDPDCERYCTEKDREPALATFCPENAPCMNKCGRSFPDHHGQAWGDCLDICVAMYIRVGCDQAGNPPPGKGKGEIAATAPAMGSGGQVAVFSAIHSSPLVPAVSETSARTRVAGASLLGSFDGKGRMANVKASGALQPSDGLEQIVAAAVSGGMGAENGELTLFERAHRKYQELFSR